MGREEPARYRGAEDGGTAMPGQRRSGLVLYPALSRRAGGLSLGVNLFPDGKRCSFDCAYCEVLPGSGRFPFSLEALESDLAAWAERAENGGGRGLVDPDLLPRDIAFAGDGEPTLSPFLEAAIESVAAVRSRWPRVFGTSKIVLITNSTGFLDAAMAATLKRAVSLHGLEVWAKLDAGTEAWYRRIDRRGPEFEGLFEALLAFARRSPLVIQSMFCRVAGAQGDSPGAMLDPPESEIDAWIGRLVDLVSGGARLDGLQVYTQSRNSPHRLTEPLDDDRLVAIARRAAVAIEARFAAASAAIPIRVFGRQSELDVSGGPP